MNAYWNNYVSVLKKYAVFDGRAGRPEFWMFVLVSIIVSFLLSVLPLPMLSPLYSLVILIPSLAVGARRLHDTGRSGWWQLIGFVPVIGLIVLIIFFAQPSKRMA
jgi:uncharacterized membrane protein YhaH (DUF805 family)